LVEFNLFGTQYISISVVSTLTLAICGLKLQILLLEEPLLFPVHSRVDPRRGRFVELLLDVWRLVVVIH
jgi:hypothetical protein